MTNSDYILFLDESAETKANPYLLLGGIIISRNNYKKFLIPSIQNTKSILGNPNIVFHYTDILKKQKDFKIMCSDAEMRTKFWDSLRNSIASVDFKIIASFTNVKEYSKEYPKLSHDVYELLFSCVKYITTTSFTVKEENSIGLQLADIVAYNCIRHINNYNVQHGMWNILETKIYDGNKKDIDSYGLVKLF